MRKNLILPLLLACGLLAFTGCGDPEGDDNDSNGDPGKPKLTITISRAANTSAGNFIFSTSTPAGATTYKVYSNGSHIQDFTSNTITLSSSTFSSPNPNNAFTPLTVNAHGSSGALSADTPVPGIRRYPAATTNLEGMQDWFHFLDVAIYGLAQVDMPSGGPHLSLRTSIQGEIPALTNESAASSLKTTYGTQANAATAAVLPRYSDILTYYVGNAAALKTLREALPRLWLNNFTDHTGTMLQHVKNQLNAAGYSHVNFN